MTSKLLTILVEDNRIQMYRDGQLVVEEIRRVGETGAEWMQRFGKMCYDAGFRDGEENMHYKQISNEQSLIEG